MQRTGIEYQRLAVNRKALDRKTPVILPEHIQDGDAIFRLDPPVNDVSFIRGLDLSDLIKITEYLILSLRQP